MGYPDWTFPIVFVLQEGELWPILEWVSRTGEQKYWMVNHPLEGGATKDTLVYTVPAKKRLYIVRTVISADQNWYVNQNTTLPGVSLLRCFINAREPFLMDFVPPSPLPTGGKLHCFSRNDSEAAGDFYSTITAYELPA